MTISDEAVEAAARAAGLVFDEPANARDIEYMRAILEAAAPFIRAEALEEAADDPALRLAGHSGVSITRLRARAAEMKGTENE